MKSSKSSPETLKGTPIVLFEHANAWAAWLDENHTTSPGLWLRLAKKASGIASVSYAEAVEVALCHGWIDGQKQTYDQTSWLQRFTPRGPRSIWSKINQKKVKELIEGGQMKPAGLAAIEQAKKTGQWDAAYDPPSAATVPPDLQAELDENAGAKAFFATLNSTNRYAILFRVQTAKKPETRARRIQQFIQMLEKNEKLYP
jgi:uncharacterized protein YdeI (YjbR/CyaY-like superfamily)